MFVVDLFQLSKGFKKISSSHYEYANPYFQANKKHLLYNIKKRTPQPYYNINAPRKRARESSSWQDVGADGSDEADIEKLKNNLNTVERVLGELKQQQDATKKRLAAIEKRIEGADVGIKQEVFTFMTNAIANPLFVKNFFKSVAKKQRLVVHQSAGGSVKLGELNKKSCEDLTTNNFEVIIDPNLKCDDKSISIAKKLLDEEDLVCVSRAEDQQHQSRIVMELEDLIAKPSGRVDFDWAEYVKELMQQSGLP
ncbi:heat stress transcription factor A-2-like [Rhododendron vialii]|uniref:heat stress transcription factor A-2-like n=1 Tax=Rhododendron vialii TaxID=182163 RepID=UPI00265DF460|nr:heat stress transcription factor A-2-like [Rhododendron vialii]